MTWMLPFLFLLNLFAADLSNEVSTHKWSHEMAKMGEMEWRVSQFRLSDELIKRAILLKENNGLVCEDKDAHFRVWLNPHRFLDLKSGSFYKEVADKRDQYGHIISKKSVVRDFYLDVHRRDGSKLRPQGLLVRTGYKLHYNGTPQSPTIMDMRSQVSKTGKNFNKDFHKLLQVSINRGVQPQVEFADMETFWAKALQKADMARACCSNNSCRTLVKPKKGSRPAPLTKSGVDPRDVRRAETLD